MTILVTGSRGRVGRALIGLLHDRGLAVRAASRAPGELELPAGVPAVRCALDEPDTFAEALKGVSSVFLYAESSQIDAFLEEAVAAGVQHIVLLSSSSVRHPDAATHAIARPHWEAEQALAAAPITTTVLQPGAFATNALGWARSIAAGTPVSLPYPGAHTDVIHEADLAEAALAVLTDTTLAGRTYWLSGPESLTFRDQIDRLARATGRTIEATEVTPEEWKREVSAFMPEQFADVLLAAWASTDGRPMPISPAVEELTGHPARSFTTWAEDHAGDFTG